MNKFIDKITHKTIEYNNSDIFTIKTKSSYNRYIVRKVYPSENIAIALSEFYALVVPKGSYKYLFKHTDGKHHHKGELILRMRGESQILPEKSLRLKESREFHRYDIVSLASLYHCPRTLFEALNAIDRSQFPPSVHKWSNQKILYCLLSKFVTLSPDERYKLLSEGEPLFIQHKINSGNVPNDVVPVDVVVDKDLL